MTNRYFIALVFVSAAAMICGFGLVSNAGEKNVMTDPVVDISPDEEVAVLHTSMGTIVLQFYPDVAPKHVENFKKLTREKFYDGVKFHRVIKGFMIQCGCPNTKKDNDRAWGIGGPGYKVKAEFNERPHLPGTLSMARSGDPNSAGSQFFYLPRQTRIFQTSRREIYCFWPDDRWDACCGQNREC